MTDSYRAILSADNLHAADIDDWFARAFPDDAHSVVRTTAGSQNVKGERWALSWRGGPNRLDINVVHGHRTLLVIERQYPATINALLDHELPSFQDLFERIGARTGPFPVTSDVSSSALEGWLNDPAPPQAQVALVVAGPEPRVTNIKGELSRGLAGLAGTAAIDLVTAERIVSYAERLSPVREGCLIYVGRIAENLDLEVLPATVVSMQPIQAVRRLRNRCLRGLSRFRFTEAEETVLIELSLPLNGGSADADALLAQLVSAEEELRRMRDELDLLILEQDDLMAQRDRLESRSVWFERRLRELNDYAIPGLEEDIPPPDSCADAVRLAREVFPYLVIGDVMDGINKLDEYEKSILWAKKGSAARIGDI